METQQEITHRITDLKATRQNYGLTSSQEVELIKLRRLQNEE